MANKIDEIANLTNLEIVQLPKNDCLSEKFLSNSIEAMGYIEDDDFNSDSKVKSEPDIIGKEGTYEVSS